MAAIPVDAVVLNLEEAKAFFVNAASLENVAVMIEIRNRVMQAIQKAESGKGEG